MNTSSNNNINYKAFPQLGGLPNEVGSGTSPGGIGGPWISNIPLPYYFFSSKKLKKSKSKKSIKKNRKSKKSIKKNRKSIKKNKKSKK